MTSDIGYREILVVTGGMTPQVVTETVYALARERENPIIPDEIICVVTQKIARRFTEELPGQLARLAKGWDISPRWGNVRVEYPLYAEDDPDKSRRGRPVQDIRSETDSVRFGDLVTEIVRQAASEVEGKDLRTRIHLSLAGGRKSMSFHAGAALSLFAREQDELSHVLVSEEFESCDDFWFPTPDDCFVRHRRTNQKHNARDARVELALLPFVRVRERLPLGLLGQQLSHANIVAQTNAALGRTTATLELATSRRSVRIPGIVEFELPNKEFALYQLMAEWCQAQIEGASSEGVGLDHSGWLTPTMLYEPQLYKNNAVRRYLEIYEETFLGGIKQASFAKELVHLNTREDAELIRDSREYFDPIKARLLPILERHLHLPALAKRFGVQKKRLKPPRFGLELLPQEITIRHE